MNDRNSGAFILAVVSACAVPLLSGCGFGERSSPAEVVDSAGVRIVVNTGPRWPTGEWLAVDPEPVASIGSQDGPDAQQLFQVTDATRLSDGILAVLNAGASELRFYDAAGAHVRTVGGNGEGPGEFQSPRWLVARSDTLVVYDPYQGTGRLSYFTLTGGFLSSQPVAVEGIGYPNPVTVLSDGTLLDVRGEPSRALTEEGHVRYTSIPVRYPLAGAPVDTLARVPGTEMFREEFRGGMSQSAVPFGREAFTAAAPDRVFVGNGEEAAVEAFDYSGTHVLSVRFPVERRAVTPERVERWIEATLDHPNYQAWPDAAERARRRFHETPVPATMPAHSELVVDRSGRLWVQRYSPPWEDANEWMVFDADGLWLGNVGLPPGLRVLEVGDDYVLGLVQDDLDVEYLHLFRIESDRD